MARIVFKKPESGGYTPLPEGLYHWEIKDSKQTTSGKGNPQLEISCECIEPSQYAGRGTKMWYSLLPQSAWKLKGLLDATDTDYEEGTGEGGEEMLAFDDENLIGKVFACKVSLGESDTGTPRNEFGKEAPSKHAPQPPAQDNGGATTTPTTPTTAAPQTAPPAAGAPGGATAFQPRSRRA